MKSISAIFCIFFFSLLLLANLGYARKDVGEYWKKMMVNQPVPDAIKDLVVVQDSSPSSGAENHNKKDHGFVRDFDIRPNVIIYHSHDMSKKTKPSVNKHLQLTVNNG